ncbi:MAG TPA: NAD(P)(+) transhydrogenase (Re/Si-specific) subunit alpha, partial [Chitinophaga sp.]
MIAGVLKEKTGEQRVSLVPEVVKQLSQQSVTVWVEPNAGALAFYPDDAYTQAGAIIKPAAEIVQQADIILSIQLPEPAIWENIQPGKILAGVYQPLYNTRQMQQAAARQLTIFSLDSIPRTTRAQSMDVLSSQANIAGYK